MWLAPRHTATGYLGLPNLLYCTRTRIAALVTRLTASTGGVSARTTYAGNSTLIGRHIPSLLRIANVILSQDANATSQLPREENAKALTSAAPVSASRSLIFPFYMLR